MQRVLLGVIVAVVSMICWPVPYALAQNTKVARGTVVDIGSKWLTVKVRDEQMKFAVDTNTVVEARGGSTKSRAAAASGKPGPRLADVLQIGQGVAVTYHEMNGSLQASHVRVVSSVPAGGGSASSEPEELTSSGTVQSVGAASITITGSGGSGASFTQTFVIDGQTRVFAKGASTAAAAQGGGRLPFSQFVGSGDKVSVSYRKMDGALHASDVRVTMKALH